MPMYWAVMVLDVMVLAATAVPQSRAAPSTTAAAREMSFVLFFFMLISSLIFCNSLIGKL